MITRIRSSQSAEKVSKSENYGWKEGKLAESVLNNISAWSTNIENGLSVWQHAAVKDRSGRACEKKKEIMCEETAISALKAADGFSTPIVHVEGAVDA